MGADGLRRNREALRRAELRGRAREADLHHAIPVAGARLHRRAVRCRNAQADLFRRPVEAAEQPHHVSPARRRDAERRGEVVAEEAAREAVAEIALEARSAQLGRRRLALEGRVEERAGEGAGVFVRRALGGADQLGELARLEPLAGVRSRSLPMTQPT